MATGDRRCGKKSKQTLLDLLPQLVKNFPRCVPARDNTRRQAKDLY
jgi:hypothetical protein